MDMGRMTPFVSGVDDYGGIYQPGDDAAEKDHQKQVAKRPT
jgi:hypothetical protein